MNNFEYKINSDRDVDWLAVGVIASAFLGPGISYGKIYLFHIFLTFYFIRLLKRIACKKISIDRSYINHFIKNDWPIFAYFIFLVISLTWTPSSIVGLRYLSQLALSLIIYCFFYIINEREFNLILKIILGIFLLEMFISLGEHFKFWRYPISSYSSVANLFLRETNPDSYASVPTGFRFNPNNLGALIAIAGPFFYFSNIFKINFLFVPIFYIGTATNARAALVSSLIGGFFALWIMGKNILWKNLKIILFFILIFLTLWKLILHEYLEMRKIYSIPRELITFFLPDRIPDDDSVRIRKNLLVGGIKNLVESHYIGTGVSGTLVTPIRANLHNYWLEVLVEGGVLGGGLFYFWYIKKIYCLAVKLIRRRSDKNFEESQLALRKSTIISLIIMPFAIISCSTAVYYSPFWLLLGIAGYLVRKDSEVKDDQVVLSSFELKK